MKYRDRSSSKKLLGQDFDEIVKEDNEGQPVYASIYDKAKAHQKNLLRSKNKKIEMIIPKNKLQEHIKERTRRREESSWRHHD